MNVIRSILFATAALGVMAALAPAGAQTPAGVSNEEPYPPAKDAKDLRSVLFNWMRNQGMLRGHDERDMQATFEYQGSGTVQVDGQPCRLTKFRASTNYQIPAQRIQYTCTRANGQAFSNIEVVSGVYAWDEDMPGAQIGSAKGKVVPKADTVEDRLIRIWASPQGAPKAAAAGTTDTFWLGANPATMFENGAMKVRNTSLKWEGGKPVLTFPLPGVDGTTATATLDSKYMTERVVVKHGNTTTEFTYGDYQDWNNPLNKIETFYAGKLKESKNGAVVRDLTTTVTESGNVYVVAPVPAAIKTAIKPKAEPLKGVIAKAEAKVDKSAATPRIAGKPDMTGVWMHTDWIGNYQGGGGLGELREIPTDGRKHYQEAD
jgi:hypothetical protein